MARRWNSTGVVIGIAENPLPSLLPRDALLFAGSHLLQAAGNLGVPRLLDICVWRAVQAVYQSGEKGRPLPFWQRQSGRRDRFKVVSHESVLPPGSYLMNPPTTTEDQGDGGVKQTR